MPGSAAHEEASVSFIRLSRVSFLRSRKGAHGDALGCVNYLVVECQSDAVARQEEHGLAQKRMLTVTYVRNVGLGSTLHREGYDSTFPVCSNKENGISAPQLRQALSRAGP